MRKLDRENAKTMRETWRSIRALERLARD